MIIDLMKPVIHRLENCQEKILVIPVGSIEYHGGVLPLSTDTLIAEGIVRYCIKNLDTPNNKCIILLPVIPISYSIEWIDYPGTITLRIKTFIEYIKDILSTTQRTIQPDKTIIVNGHGGNYSLLEAILREENSGEEKTYLIDIWKIASRMGLKYCHACRFEAELLNYLYGTEFRGVEEEACRDEYIVTSRYKPGYCGIELSVESFLEKICSIIRSLL